MGKIGILSKWPKMKSCKKSSYFVSNATIMQFLLIIFHKIFDIKTNFVNCHTVYVSVAHSSFISKIGLKYRKSDIFCLGYCRSNTKNIFAFQAYKCKTIMFVHTHFMFFSIILLIWFIYSYILCFRRQLHSSFSKILQCKWHKDWPH